VPKPPIISARAKRVWQRLTEWYGSRFTEQYGESPPEDWCASIDHVDNETVKRGLAAIRSKYAAHPPTFPQFDEAMAPIRSTGVRTESITDQLCAFVAHKYGSGLTPSQMRGPWVYIGRQFDSVDLTQKLTANHGVEITGVVIDADGDSPGYRVTVDDMLADAQDAFSRNAA
jgi:hypothetical protein